MQHDLNEMQKEAARLANECTEPNTRRLAEIVYELCTFTADLGQKVADPIEDSRV